MNSRNYDVYQSFAHEHNSRILKASDDARRLRSLSKKADANAREPSGKRSRSGLLNSLTSLLRARKQQPA